jgi:hypothetical protein
MNIFAFVIAFILFIGGIFLFGLAFDVQGAQALVFVSGLAAIVIAMAIPFHILKRIDR